MPLPAPHRTHELPGLADNHAINHPANLPGIYAGLAQLRDLSLDTLAHQIEQNFHAFFVSPSRP